MQIVVGIAIFVTGYFVGILSVWVDSKVNHKPVNFRQYRQHVNLLNSRLQYQKQLYLRKVQSICR